MLVAEYDGWSVPAGVIIYEDQRAVLVVLSKDEKNIAVILEKKDGGFTVTAVSDAIIPDGVGLDDHWWISENGVGRPFIWYTPAYSQGEFYYELCQDGGGNWRVDSGSFSSPSDEASRLAFQYANHDTALRISGESYFSAVYAPVDVDLSFGGFDPARVKSFCADAMAQKNGPALIPSTLEADALPQGQVVAFARGKKYPVYAGPGRDYMQLGEHHNATVSTNDWIQVFGQENGWLLIQYNVSDGANRFGYIMASALPRGVQVPELQFERRAGALTSMYITDDPLRTVAEINLPVGTECVQLATMGDEWAYIETVDPSQPKYRGFVSPDGVDLRENHAGKAIIQVERTPLYPDARAENPIGEYFGGVELDVLQIQGDFAEVRIGSGLACQEGWMACAALAMNAVPSDVPITPPKAVLCAPVGDYIPKAYAGSSEDSQRIRYTGDYRYLVLGEVNGFAQLLVDRWWDASPVFVPRDWVIPVPEGAEYYHNRVLVTLTADSPAYIRPDPSAPSLITLYEGVTVRCYPAGDWYFIADDALVPSETMDIKTFGYLPASVCVPASGDAVPVNVGMLTPENQGDNRRLYVSMHGNIDGCYGWGTRFLLLGETASRYLVRTPLEGYGFFDKADITPTSDRIPQEDYTSLLYGTTTLAKSSGYYDIPFTVSQEFDQFPAGTSVKLLGCLGDWWSVCVGDRSVFMPAEVLQSVPDDVPAYDGIYNSFRTMPFMVTWPGEPSMGHTDTDVWMLLRDDGQPVLSHMERQGGAWVETGRTGALLGEDVRLVSGFQLDACAVPFAFTVECYLEGSNVKLRSTFTMREDDWILTGFQMSMTEYLDDLGEHVLYDRTIISTETGWTLQEDGQEREISLQKPSALALEQYSAKEMLAACLAAIE